MSVPATDRAYARGEDAPAGLEAVELVLAVLLEARPSGSCYVAADVSGNLHGPRHDTRLQCEAWIERSADERTVTYWVGLAESGAINVDAATARAAIDFPDCEVIDWCAA